MRSEVLEVTLKYEMTTNLELSLICLHTLDFAEILNIN